MDRFFLKLGLSALALLVAPLAAQSWDETTNGGGDAGDAIATVQVVAGSGVLNEITGDVASAADRDIFQIRISNAAAFSANTTTNPGLNTDTQLRLFTLAGVPIAHNDDTAVSLLSELPVGNALYNALPAGDYLLAVSGWNSRSNSSSGDQFPLAYGVVVGPSNTNPLTGWTGSNALGTYRVTLTGCEYVVVTPPGDPEINLQYPVTVNRTSGATVTLGSIPAASMSAFTITVQNLGATQNLAVSAIGATPTGPGNCTVNTTALSPASPLAPAGSSTFNLEITPTSFGAFQCTVTVTNNDADEGTYTLIFSGSASMGGNFTITSAGGGDYTDIGAAFDDLETNGVGGPITLTITDSANYTSTSSYSLGLNSTFATAVALGTSPTNTVTLRAAPGQNPTITGSATGAGVAGYSARGALCIAASYVIVEGITVTGGPNFGIVASGTGPAAATNVTIRRCKVYGIGSGPGIAYVAFGAPIGTNIVIENNFVWNCFGTSLPGAAFPSNVNGSICIRNPGAGMVVQHNSVLHDTAVAATAGFRVHDGSGTANRVATFSNNIIQVTSATLPALQFTNANLEPVVAGTDFNNYFSTVFENNGAVQTFATWQGTGRDTNGITTDPQFVSVSGATSDLHLQSTSPCVDPTGQTSTVNIDIDGDTRPSGATADRGADEYLSTFSIINVYEGVGTGGAQFSNPDTVSGLLIGPAGSGLDYTIENDATATADLVMPSNPVSFTFNSGATAVSVVITQPSSLTVTAGNTIGFLVTITTINTGGTFDFDLEIASNDPNDNPFVINFSGNAIANNPARANPETVTSSPVFTGTADSGPFGFAADPGTTVASSLTIDDADADDVLITLITPAGAQAGITAAASAAGPAATLSVNFTGTLDANAPPGVYTWTIDIEDDQVPAGSRTITVNITLNNVAPVGTNTAIAPTTGTGVDLANAYARTFFETTTVASTNLFDVTDVNLGQTLAILSQTRTGGTGTTFPFNGQFAITGSAGSFTVSVSTAGALVATDVGTHEYQLVIEDVTGGNQITVFVTLTVSAQTAPTFVGGAAATIAQGASQTGVVVGDAADGQDPFSALGVAATTVPTGITVSAIAVNATNGEVTATISVGAAATPGVNTITFTVTDSLSATGTGTFDVNVTANGIPTITAGSAVSMGANSSVTNRTIATVGDAEDAAGTLTVTVLSAPAGVAVTAITNTTGTVTATITTTAATAGANVVQLQVMDSAGATATANLTVNVSTGGGGGGGGGGDDDGGGCVASGSSSSLWLALFGLVAFAALGLRARRSRA